MYFRCMDSEEAFQIVDAAVVEKTGKHLTNVQRAILIGSFEGQTYKKIAANCRYSPEYLLQDAGPGLWKLLAKVYNVRVSKNNFQSVLATMERRSRSILTSSSGADAMNPLEVSGEIRMDWGMPPDAPRFYGRLRELDELEQWIRISGCRLVTIYGVGGVGKTTLAIRLAQKVKDRFDYLIRRSLDHRPPLHDLMKDLIQFFSNHEDTSTDLPRLHDYLRNHRCLVILEQFETVLQSGVCDEAYLPGYDSYSKLLRLVGNAEHQSCLILTSREKPKDVAVMEGEPNRVSALRLEGLGESAGREFCMAKNIFSHSDSDWRQLINRYEGNPAALTSVATIVRDVFSGNVTNFLEELRQGTAIRGDIGYLLDEQIKRLSELENSIVQYLVQRAEPVTLNEIFQALSTSTSRMQLQEGLQALMRRSLLKIHSNHYLLPNLIAEYLVNQS